VGIETGVYEQFSGDAVPDNLAGPLWEPDKVASIRMMIGSKP
jgi:hypothetical protein